jgi:hypothetical protein
MSAQRTRPEDRGATTTPGGSAPPARSAAADPPVTRTPAALLARLSIAPALALVAWLIVGLPLLMAGKFHIGLAFALYVPVAVVVLTLGLRDVPARSGGSWWSVAGVVAVAVAFLALQIAMCSEQIVVRRDAASYVQFATWITDYGSLPIPQSLWAFGGGDPALSFNSPAFYERGDVIVPQFLAGLPMILGLSGWIGGTSAMLITAPVLGALAVLSFGGLVSRLVGPRWAPVGALVLALTLPLQFVARSTYSEPAALILILGGLAMAVDALDLGREARRRADREAAPDGDREAAAAASPTAIPAGSAVSTAVRSLARRAGLRAGLAGLALGLTQLIRIDALADLLPVVLFAALLFVLRRPGAVPLFAGFLVGAALGVTEALVMSRPYVDYLGHAFYPLLWGSAGIAVVTAVVAVVLRRAWLRPLLRSRVRPRLRGFVTGRACDVAAVSVVLVMIGFAVRPYLQTVYKSPSDRTAQAIAAFQRIYGLPVDPGRQYYEMSLYWVAWYVGLPVVLFATFGAALLIRRLARGHAPRWVLPYAVITLGVLKALWDPAITPDHPWASRRLVPVVIPGLILLAVWTLAWVVRRARRYGYGSRVAGIVAASGAIVLAVPVVATSGGLMFSPIEKGELAAVRGMCRLIGPGASVLIVDRATGDRFSQVTRGMCQLPVARIDGRREDDVRRVIGKIKSTSRRPVIVGAEPGQVRPYGTPKHALHLVTRQDEHSLVDPPDGTWRLVMNVWMAEPPPA